MSSNLSDSAASQGDPGGYLLVWNDTVRPKTLLAGVLCGIIGSLIGLYGGRALFGLFVDNPDLVHVWSLATALVGCLGAGFVTALIAKPAREIVETPDEAGRIENVVTELAADPKGLGSLDDASDMSRRELEQAGLTSVFEEFEQSRKSNTDKGGER